MIDIHYIGHATSIPNWPEADTVAGLLDALSRWDLEPQWDNSKSPEFEPHPLRAPYRSPALRSGGQRYDETLGHKIYLAGPALYPNAPDAVTFLGNFVGYSFGFHLSTDEPELIAQLDAAIADNMARRDKLCTVEANGGARCFVECCYPPTCRGTPVRGG